MRAFIVWSGRGDNEGIMLHAVCSARSDAQELVEVLRELAKEASAPPRPDRHFSVVEVPTLGGFYND